MKKIIVIALTLASLSLTAGLAVAAQFVGNGGSIQGCVKSGLLEVVKAGKRCPRHSTPLPFDRVGPRGRQGIQGVQGPQGRHPRASYHNRPVWVYAARVL